MRRLAARARERRAQATVEMAIVAPVMVVLALVAYSLMLFTAAVARFDRVVPDVVLAHGVSPAGGEGSSTASMVETVRCQVASAMEGYDVEVEVAVGEEGREEASVLALVGARRTFTCTMRFRTWPGSFAIAGVPLGAPAALCHERAVTVDPWRPGVVL